jgi:hypothetical protein
MNITRGSVQEQISENKFRIMYLDSKSVFPYDQFILNGKTHDIKPGAQFLVDSDDRFEIRSENLNSRRVYQKKTIKTSGLYKKAGDQLKIIWKKYRIVWEKDVELNWGKMLIILLLLIFFQSIYLFQILPFYLEYGYWVVILYLYLYNSVSLKEEVLSFDRLVEALGVGHLGFLLFFFLFLFLISDILPASKIDELLLRYLWSNPLFKTGYFISSTINNMIYIYIAHYIKSSYYITTLILLILISYIFKKINHIIDPIYINYELTKIDDFGILVKKIHDYNKKFNQNILIMFEFVEGKFIYFILDSDTEISKYGIYSTLFQYVDTDRKIVELKTNFVYLYKNNGTRAPMIDPMIDGWQHRVDSQAGLWYYNYILNNYDMFHEAKVKVFAEAFQPVLESLGGVVSQDLLPPPRLESVIMITLPNKGQR